VNSCSALQCLQLLALVSVGAAGLRWAAARYRTTVTLLRSISTSGTGIEYCAPTSAVLQLPSPEASCVFGAMPRLRMELRCLLLPSASQQCAQHPSDKTVQLFQQEGNSRTLNPISPQRLQAISGSTSTHTQRPAAAWRRPMRGRQPGPTRQVTEPRAPPAAGNHEIVSGIGVLATRTWRHTWCR
jgi:hypothetical protein